MHGPKLQPLAFLGLKAMLGEKSKSSMVSLADSPRKKAFAFFFFFLI